MKRGKGIYRDHVEGGLARATEETAWAFEFTICNNFQGIEHTLHGCLHACLEADMFVLPGLVFVTSNLAVSHSSLIPLSHYCAALGNQAPARAAPQRAAPPLGRDSMAVMIAQQPWLINYVDEARDIVKRHKAHHGQRPGQDGPEDDVEPEEDPPCS